jgi:hypothetical protein
VTSEQLDERIAARQRCDSLRARLIRVAADSERLADHEVTLLEQCLAMLGKL